MAFVENTKIFTDSGWKDIQEISGQDKVLVRNFIGDAEFIQPFALKKSHYDGEVIKIGGRNWSFMVTPEHTVVYDRNDMPVGSNFTYVPAKEMEIHNTNRIYRKFKYLPPDEYKREQIIIYTEFGKKYVTISNEDWFVLCAYVLCKGRIEYSSGRPTLLLFIDEDKSEQQLSMVGDILDRIGVEWTLTKRDRYFIRVKVNNTLANRVATRLGKIRKEMYLPNKMIYNSTRQLADLLIETIITTSISPDTERGNNYQFTCGEKLAESLVLLGTLHGYGVTSFIAIPEGTETNRATVKRDIYRVNISNLTKTYSPTIIEKSKYNGNVYEIDLFDGQVYVKEGMPVWVEPK